MATQQYKAWSVVIASTLSFTVCFMIWMMFAVLGIPIKEQLGLSETQFGILAATPVLSSAFSASLRSFAMRAPAKPGW